MAYAAHPVPTPGLSLDERMKYLAEFDSEGPSQRRGASLQRRDRSRTSARLSDRLAEGSSVRSARSARGPAADFPHVVPQATAVSPLPLPPPGGPPDFDDALGLADVDVSGLAGSELASEITSRRESVPSTTSRGTRPDADLQAESLRKAAEGYLRAGDYALALFALRAVLDLVTQGPDGGHPARVVALRDVAEVHAKRGEYEEATARYEEALESLDRAAGGGGGHGWRGRGRRSAGGGARRPGGVRSWCACFSPGSRG